MRMHDIKHNPQRDFTTYKQLHGIYKAVITLRRTNSLPLHRLRKSLQRQLRRIIRNLMTRAKNPQKA